MKIDEAGLVKRILERDQKAFDEFYEHYAPSVLRRLYRMTGDSVMAEECLQQVFTECFVSLPKYRGDGALGAWVNRIATHVVMDAFRRKHRWKAFWEGASADEWKEEQVEDRIPEGVFLRDETRQWMRSILEKIAPRKRMVLLLCDMEGVPLEEASEQLQIPIGTVASRLFHARRDLRGLIERELLRSGLTLGDLIHE